MNEKPGPNHERRMFKLGQLMRCAQAKFHDALDGELAARDMTAAQYLVFAQIAAQANGSAAGFCKDRPYDSGAMTRMLDRLEKKNLLRRVRSMADRRTVQLEISAQGRSLHPLLDACCEQAAGRFFRGFSPAELAQFENFFARLMEND